MQWPALPLDPMTIVFTVGLLYTVMPLTVWTVLRGRYDSTTTTLWCVGSLLSGVNYVLFGLRESLPMLVTLHLANAIGYLAYALRWAALRRERGASTHPRLLLVLVVLATTVYSLAATQGVQVRVSVFSALVFVTAGALAWEARQLAHSRGSRSAAMVAVTYALLAGTGLLRLFLLQMQGQNEEQAVFDFTIDVYLLLFAGLLSALWGNIGYLGVAMENAQRLESTRRAELAAATARSEAAERQALALKTLSDEREELLRVIAHEARQPLHNAQAVLQGVDGALDTGLPASKAAAARITRARAVLQQITATLDNTLAVSTLLVEARPSRLRDADLDMLVELTLGDLPAAQRGRVQVRRDTQVRTAAMDVGLMRLALRNVLNNALAYALPGSAVVLRLTDTDEPLALVIAVQDSGPGIDPALLPHIFERGTRGRHDLHGQGLGLYIVRRAMLRQGGTVDVVSSPAGTTFTLVLPQGVEPD